VAIATSQTDCSKIKNQNKIKIVGHVSHCLIPECAGWLVDSFAGKYWIRCKDPKHIDLNSRVDIDIDATSGNAHATKNDNHNDDELAVKQGADWAHTTQPNQPDQSISHKSERPHQTEGKERQSSEESELL
jgi:hypothetical protein